MLEVATDPGPAEHLPVGLVTEGSGLPDVVLTEGTGIPHKSFGYEFFSVHESWSGRLGLKSLHAFVLRPARDLCKKQIP